MRYSSVGEMRENGVTIDYTAGRFTKGLLNTRIERRSVYCIHKFNSGGKKVSFVPIDTLNDGISKYCGRKEENECHHASSGGRLYLGQGVP